MAAPVPGDFHSEEVYQRQLTANDMTECSRLYMKTSPARRICPEAFGPPPEENYTRALRFFDAGLNPLPMVFLKRGNKHYLIGGWRHFVKANMLSRGDIIRIHKLTSKSGTGESFFMIGSVQVAGVLIG